MENIKLLILSILFVFLSVMVLDAAEVKITWKPSMNATGYRIYYGETPDNMRFSVNTGQLTTYIVRRLECGKQYYFYVIAYNDAGENNPSNTVSKTTDICPEFPALPEGWEIDGLVLVPVE